MADQVTFPALRQALQDGPFALLRNELHQLERRLAPTAEPPVDLAAAAALPTNPNKAAGARPVFSDPVQLCLVQLGQLLDASNRQEQIMSGISDGVDQLKADMLAQKTQVDAAVAFITGVPALMATAVEDALAAGATADQLESLTELHTAITSQTSELAAALTPAPGGGTTGATGATGA